MIGPITRTILLSLSSIILCSCGGGGGGGAEGETLEQTLPDHNETIKPCSIRLGDECVITLIRPVQHPSYEATFIFADDMINDGQLSYSTSSLNYLVSMGDTKQVTIHSAEMTPSSNRLTTRKYSLRANMTFSSPTEGTATWEIQEGPANSTARQTKTGSGAFTVSER